MADQTDWDSPRRRFPHAEPTPYHEMLRTWSYAWWKPVVGVLLAVVSFFLAAGLTYLLVVTAGSALESGPFAEDYRRNIDTDNVGPIALLATNLGLGSMILVTWALVRVVHRLRPRWLTSVVPRMRWRLFATCLGLAVLALAAQVAVGQLLPLSGGQDPSGHLNPVTPQLLLTALVVLCTTPLQAAGEEYLFRGYLLMAFGSFFRSRWVAIGATSVLFAVAHYTQNPPLFLDRLAFGLIAGWLVTRTGGLEAGIALHVLNNFLAFGVAIFFGDLTSTLTVTEVSWWQLVLTVTQSGVYVGLVLLVSRWRPPQNRTRPPMQESDATYGTVTRTV